jgi:hypothetical protein
MCCDTTVCGARSETCRFVFCASEVVSHTVDVTSQLGRFKSVGRDAVVSMTPAQPRCPAQVKVKPVRQCARRGASAPGVAQASPLFSDHAPREVHLWQ